MLLDNIYRNLYRDPFEVAMRATPRAHSLPMLSDEERDGLLSTLGQKTLSGIAAAGNVLDTPAGAIRTAMVGENPLTGAISPSSRPSGRDVLEEWGVLGRNTPGLDVGDVAGFAFEVATDPLTYATFGGSALSKAGQVARSAGLMDDAVKVASSAAGKAVGPRTARLTTSLDDLMGLGPTVARAKAQRAAEGMGLDLAEVGSQKLGGMVGLGAPFRDPSMLIGTGPVGEKVAKGLDKIGETVRYSRPGRVAAELFSPSVQGTRTVAGQKAAAELYGAKEAARQRARGQVAEHLQSLIDSGHSIEDFGPEMRQMLEGTKSVDPAIQPFVDRTRGQLDDLLTRSHKLGIRSSELQDAAGIDYFPRYLSGEPQAGRGVRVFNVQDPSDVGRQAFLKGLRGGTETIRQMAMDPMIGGQARQLTDPTQVRQYIARKYGSEFVGDDQLDRMATMGRWLGDLPEDVAKAGGFANHPMSDLAARMISGEQHLAAADGLLDFMAQQARHVDEVPLGTDTRTIGELFQSAGMEVGDESMGALKQLADRMGAGWDKNLLDFRVDADIAADMTRLMQSIKAPEAVNEVVDVVDSFTNLFKVGATSTLPNFAFHGRNLTSGQWQNWVAGLFSPKSVHAAKNIMEGGVVDDALQIPLVREILQKRGLPQDAQNATNVLRQLAMQYDMVSKYQGEYGNIVGQAANTAGDMFSELPGVNPATVSGSLRQAVPRSLAEANPLNVRGVFGRDETLFAPARAGESLGYYVEGLNRLSPFIEGLKQGMDPAAVAAKVKAAQVDYAPRAFTRFEQQAVKRLIPFYSFCVPTDHEILTWAGWKTHDQLEIGEMVLSYDHEKNELAWTPLEDVNVFDHHGNLLKYEQSRKGKKTEFLFTENHSWPVVTEERDTKHTRADGSTAVYRRTAKRKMLKGYQLKSGHRIPKCGEFHGTASVLPPRLARILGWVITDGYRRKRGNHTEMLVYQSPGKHLDEIIELLGTKPRKPHPESGVVPVPVALKDVKAIVPFLEKAPLPSIAARLSRESAEAMYDAMFKAEGSTSEKGNRHFAQSPEINKDVLDCFQILCLLTGRSANLSKVGCYIAKSKHYWIKKPLKREFYSGKVWCPTTKHGTWVMRHNGDVIITGNTSRQMPYQLRQLIERPGGKVAQSIRAANVGREEEGFLPEHIGQTTALPWGGETDEGMQRYITGFGLPHEDVLGLVRFGGSPTRTLMETGQELMGRTNPLFKAPVELMAGKQFFTGRDMRDLDSPIGRILSNAGVTEEPPNVPMLLDQFVANSPASRQLGTVRTLTDPRKGAGAKALNLLTGIRVSDVNMPVQRSVAARELLEDQLRGKQGVRMFEHLYVPEENLEQLSPDDLEAYQLYRALAAMAQRKAREREAQEQGRILVRP